MPATPSMRLWKRRRTVMVELSDSPDVVGTTSPFELQLYGENEEPLHEEVLLELGVFDDANGVTLASAGEGSLKTATVGNILLGDDTRSVKIKTSPLGAFACTLAKTSPGTVYVLAVETFGSPALECSDLDGVTFS